MHFFALTLSVCGWTLYFLSKDLSFITKNNVQVSRVIFFSFFHFVFYFCFALRAANFFYFFCSQQLFSSAAAAAVGGAALVQHII